MANYIDNLLEHNMQCIMLTAGVPSDNRIVHIYDINKDNIPICAPVRYQQGKWIGALTGNELEGMSAVACWGESIFSTAMSAGTIDNRTGRHI